jgi:hypothetical protein
MLLTGSFRILICVAAMTFALASGANAALVRTFISSAGNDSNASGGGCIVTAPCRTLAGAYPGTVSGGEIVMMDPGGYGCLTITTPLSIIGTNGATSTATSGACIVITVPSSGNVLIRDLEITGANAAGNWRPAQQRPADPGQCPLEDAGHRIACRQQQRDGPR